MLRNKTSESRDRYLDEKASNLAGRKKMNQMVEIRQMMTYRGDQGLRKA